MRCEGVAESRQRADSLPVKTCSPSAMSTTKSRCPAPSQRRGRPGRAQQHTADAVRHWLGHKCGFGNTLDQTLLKVLGCKERGHKSQGPLVHATGKGWVKEHKGQYYDALHVKNGIVKICLVESQGGIAPPTKRIIHNLCLGWPILFIRLTCYLGRSRSIQLSRSISCDLAAISPIRAVFLFFFALRAHRRSFPPALYGSQPQPQPQPRPRPRPRPQPFLLLLVLGGFGGARGAHAARTR